MGLTRTLIAMAVAVLIISTCFHKTEAKIKLKKLLKAGLVLGALGSKKFPSFIPIPLPIPINLNGHQSFAGGHFGNDYPGYQSSGFAPAYGSGGYAYGSGGYGGNALGGGGYAAQGGWW